MKKKTLFCLTFGIAAAAAIAITVNKISKEIKSGCVEEKFDSPLGNNWVTVSQGSSETAKGLTYIKINAEADWTEDSCKLVLLAGKDAEISGVWDGNTFFRLLVGKGKYKPCCDIDFDGEEITMHYYLVKAEI